MKHISCKQAPQSTSQKQDLINSTKVQGIKTLKLNKHKAGEELNMHINSLPFKTELVLTVLLYTDKFGS